MSIKLIGWLCLAWSSLFQIVTAAEQQQRYDCPALETATRGNLSMTQGSDGWFFRTGADLGDDFYLSEETKSYLRRLGKALKQKGVQLIYLPIAPRGLIANKALVKNIQRQARFDNVEAKQAFDDFVSELKTVGMIVPNLLETVQSEEQRQGFFFKRDIHWSPIGARIAAQAVASELHTLPGYEELATLRYRTEETGTEQLIGKMALTIQSLCNSKIPPEPYVGYETRLSLDQDSDNADLFGSPAEGATLVLLGSSFSAVEAFNFDGFLAQSTRLEVANHAIVGGQLFTAIVSYLSSTALAQQAPTFLLWEAPAYYNLNRDSASAFRQIIPAVHGACSEAEAIASSRKQITQEQPATLLTLPADLGISSSAYYLYLATANRSLNKFTVNIQYADGDLEWFAVDRAERYLNQGRFFIEFSDDIESAITEVSISGLPNINTELETRLCQTPTT